MWSDNSECYIKGKVVTSSGHRGRAQNVRGRICLQNIYTVQNRECFTLIAVWSLHHKKTTTGKHTEISFVRTVNLFRMTYSHHLAK